MNTQRKGNTMRRIGQVVAAAVVIGYSVACSAAGSGENEKKVAPVSRSVSVQETPMVVASAAEKPSPVTAQKVARDSTTNSATAKTPKKTGKVDTLKVIARVIEIPGTFPPNDLYNYVYVMKYRVVKVLSGTCSQQEILVGHYNPLIPRRQIKDKMDPFVDGDVEKFEVGASHSLVLIKPIDLVWSEAVEDDYFDVDASEKYYALRADMAK